MMRKGIAFASASLLCGALSIGIIACGGGGSDDSPAGAQSSRTVHFHGEVESGSLQAKAEENEGFAGYSVCTFGACGQTDKEGEFSFDASLPAQSVATEVEVNGPAFSDDVDLTIPSNVSDVDIEIIHDQGKKLTRAAEIKFDGIKDESQGDESFNDGD